MDSNESENEVENEPPKKRNQHVWVGYKKLKNVNEERVFFREEKNWKIQKKSKVVDGTKVFFYCSSGSGQNRCPAKLSTFKSNSKSTIIVQMSGEHVHPNIEQKMTPEVLEKIKLYVAMNMKPRAISHEIRRNPNLPIKPTKRQVSTYSSYTVFIASHS